MADAGDKTKALLAALWKKNLPVLQERLAELDHAAEAAATGTLPSTTREAASGTAHKLAGSMGMFGYPEATEFARKIEQILESNDAIDAIAFKELTTSLRKSLSL